MTTNINPRLTQAFRFVRCSYANGVAELVYAFDHGEELIERVRFPNAPALPASHHAAFDNALKMLHLIAGVSYYKAGIPPRIEVANGPLDDATADLLDALYLHGLAEFAYRNGLDLRGRINFPRGGDKQPEAKALGLPHRTLVPIGGGKDSLVAVEAIKSMGGEATAVWVGNSPLIAACAERTGLPMLNNTHNPTLNPNRHWVRQNRLKAARLRTSASSGNGQALIEITPQLIEVRWTLFRLFAVVAVVLILTVVVVL